MHRQFHKCSASLVRHPCFFCIGLLPLENKDVTTLAGVVAITDGTASVCSKSANGLFEQPPAPQFVALTGGKISIRKGEDAVPSPFRIQIWLMRRRKTICVMIGCWQCEQRLREYGSRVERRQKDRFSGVFLNSLFCIVLLMILLSISN